MSSIVLSASVRQNLLSLQSTASLLATTQNDLATGNKVNSALDDPTSFFTASALNNRAGDISNLLDGIGNGVQVLQAANTGITSLQSLVASAQSIANQVLQTPIGYSAKSSVSTAAITGATANNLLGTASATGPATLAVATATGAPTVDLTPQASKNAVATATGAITPIDLTAGAAVNAAVTGTTNLTNGISDATALSFSINGTAVTLAAGSGTGTGATFSLTDIVGKINTTPNVGVVASDDGQGHLVLTSSGTAGPDDSIDVSAIGTAFGITAGAVTVGAAATNDTFEVNGTAVTLAGGTSYDGAAIASAIQSQVTGVTASYATGKLVISSTGTAGAADQVALSNFTGNNFDATSLGFASAAPAAFKGADASSPEALTFNVNGQAVSLAGGTSYDATTIAAAINTQAGDKANVNATVDATTGGLVLTSTGTAGANDQVEVNSFSSGDATQLGFANASEIDNGAAATESITGQTLTIASTGGGTATNITFGTAAGQISTLNALNTALSANNLQATIDSTGVLTITTSNNAASSTIGRIDGSSTETNGAFNGLVGGTPVVDPNAQATRTGLVDQYNNILAQIDTTSQDSSFNGINLLQGDTLNLTFDETGKSTLAIKGVTFNTAGLGLSTLTTGTDFLDSNSANAVLSSLTQVSTTLRSEASNLGSNLSIVQIRQDFSKNLINVLQTGASNLTLADTNEEAASSQALSTRQSIAVSALALANQSQQSVLQLLR